MLSFITPVLNGERFIARNIESIQKIGVPFEHIIVDGYSTDKTRSIAKQYPHVNLITESNKSGMYGAINDGCSICSGDYITYVNCDDYILPTDFKKMFLKAQKGKYDLVYSGALFHYSEKNVYTIRAGVGNGAYFLKNGILPFVQPSSIFSKKIFNTLKGFNSHLKIAGDLDFFQRMSIQTSRICNLKGLATVFLKYGGSLGDMNLDIYRKELQLMRVKRSKFINAYFSLLLRVNNILLLHYYKNVKSQIVRE